MENACFEGLSERDKEIARALIKRTFGQAAKENWPIRSLEEVLLIKLGLYLNEEPEQLEQLEFDFSK